MDEEYISIKYERTFIFSKDERIRIILIILISVSIFGLLIFVFVKNYLKRKLEYYLNEKDNKNKS